MTLAMAIELESTGIKVNAASLWSSPEMCRSGRRAVAAMPKDPHRSGRGSRGGNH
jgi:hypothetical protein